MIDQWVKNVQDWLNINYTGVSGWNPVSPDGMTGWQTMYALTRALQHELGITALADNFGTGTMTALTTQYGDIGPSTTNPNIINILIGALYCKGYNAGNGTLPGTWLGLTSTAVNSLQTDAGLPLANAVSPKLFKAILTMDAYTVIGSGTEYVRDVQRWMNSLYVNQSWFSIIPADGSYSRDVQKALVAAIQTELGVTADGNFGDGSRAAVNGRTPIKVGDTDASGKHWVQLFQAALRFNRIESGFYGTFSSTDSTLTAGFQRFACLPETGKGDYQTWCSLLVSNGDYTRKGTAGDCVSEITPQRAQWLVQGGRTLIGRYLTNASGGTLDKNIKDTELLTIFSNGLRVFPIFETSGTSAAYFTRARGVSDAADACTAAAEYGLYDDTVIYFAVDYDATDTEIATNVIPYFQGLNEQIAKGPQGGGFARPAPYRVGVYGTRNVCNQLDRASLAVNSFVADMSTGFSGNLGFPLPQNWAFDQLTTFSLGDGSPGSGSIMVDNDLASGRDPGQSTLIGSAAADKYAGKDPQASGISAGAISLPLGFDQNSVAITSLQVPDMTGASGVCTVEVRYNQGYCWFRYNGGNSNHTRPGVQLRVGKTVILRDWGDGLGIDPNRLWSPCSLLCTGLWVTFEYRGQGAWVVGYDNLLQ